MGQTVSSTVSLVMGTGCTSAGVGGSMGCSPERSWSRTFLRSIASSRISTHAPAAKTKQAICMTRRKLGTDLRGEVGSLKTVGVVPSEADGAVSSEAGWVNVWGLM